MTTYNIQMTSSTTQIHKHNITNPNRGRLAGYLQSFESVKNLLKQVGFEPMNLGYKTSPLPDEQPGQLEGGRGLQIWTYCVNKDYIYNKIQSSVLVSI